MIAVVEDDLREVIAKTLNETTDRAVEKVLIEIKTNIGEVKIYEFNSVEAAMTFLEDFSIDAMLNHQDTFSLFDQHFKPIENEE